MSTAREARALVEKAYQSDDQWDRSFGAARQLLENALRNDPSNVVLLTCYGTVLSDIGRHGEAVDVLRKAIALGSRDRNTWFNLGVALVNTGDHESGREVLAKAARFSPGQETWEAYFDPQAH